MTYKFLESKTDLKREPRFSPYSLQKNWNDHKLPLLDVLPFFIQITMATLWMTQYRGNAVWQWVLALCTFKGCLFYRWWAKWTGWCLLFLLSLLWFAYNGFNFFLVSFIYLTTSLRPHQHGSKVEWWIFESWSLTLNDSRG